MHTRRVVAGVVLATAMLLTGCRSDVTPIDAKTPPSTRIEYRAIDPQALPSTTTASLITTDAARIDAIEQLITSLTWERLDGALSIIPDGTLLLTDQSGGRVEITVTATALLTDASIARLTASERAELDALLAAE